MSCWGCKCLVGATRVQVRHTKAVWHVSCYAHLINDVCNTVLDTCAMAGLDAESAYHVFAWHPRIEELGGPLDEADVCALVLAPLLESPGIAHLLQPDPRALVGMLLDRTI